MQIGARNIVLVALVLLPLPAAAQLAINGQSLTVTTTNAIATFAGPDLVGFQNLVTRESYLKKPSSGTLAWIDMMSPTGQAFQTSNWTIGSESGTGLAVGTIYVQDSIRVLTLQVKIDPASQEIVIRVSANSSSPGLRDEFWTIAGLDLSVGRLIVPASGGLVYDAAHPGTGTFLEYPGIWHAQMAVYESTAGSFVLYSTDRQSIFKQLRTSSRGDSTLDVSIATEAIAPFPSATTIPTVEWRLKAFAGTWPVAAQVYKDWLSQNRPPVSNPVNSWVQSIRTVALLFDYDTTLVDSLAMVLAPSETLLYLVGWRQSGYDVNYPDYTPAAGIGPLVNHAHSLGFKVMLHLDEIGVTPSNADFATVQAYQVRTPDTLQPFGWLWDLPPSTPNRFAWINPASSAYRSLFIARVATAVSALQPDALHLDVSGALFNDGNGLIEGMTYAQGSVQLHKDLIAAFPNVVLAGESENDLLYGYESFAQAWYDAIPAPPGHPIATFLFEPQVHFYTHLGQQPASDPSFKNSLNALETRAVSPSLVISASSDLDSSDPDNARLFRILQSWQNNAFQPDWTSNTNGALVRYRGLNNSTASLTDSGTLASLTAQNVTLYQQAHDTSQVSSTNFIPYWPAFDATSFYGLDPTVRYWVDPSARLATTHVSSLPPGLQLGLRTLITPGFAHVELLPPAAASFDFPGNFFYARTGVNYQGTDYPLANGAVAQNSYLTSGGVNRPAIVTHPPYLAQVGGETYLQYSVSVPADASLLFSIGMADYDSCTDGVTLRITANGSEIFRRNITTGGWQDSGVSLSAYAGTTISLRLLSNPGPNNNTFCDSSAWSQLQLVSVPPPISTSVPLSLAAGSVYSGFAGDGLPSGTGSSSPVVSNVPVPGQFTVFTQPGRTVAAGTNLASLPFEIWKAGPTGLPQPGSVFGAGTVWAATVGGVVKSPTIFAIPPQAGYAIFSWVVNLPASGGLQLSWNSGIDDFAASADGVQFLVYVNGVAYWTWTTAENRWKPGALDLSPWKGQNVLVQLVTFAGANNNSDSAEWADLVFSANGGQSTLPLLHATISHTGNFTAGQPGARYRLTIDNAAAVSSGGTVTVTETVPPGLVLVGMSGDGWSCSVKVCSRSDALNGNASYPPIVVTVDVLLNAPAQVTNGVLVEGGGSLSASAIDLTTVNPLPCDLNGDLSIDVADVQRIISEALGLISAADDLNRDGVVNVIDIQKEINAVLGLGCQY